MKTRSSTWTFTSRRPKGLTALKVLLFLAVSVLAQQDPNQSATKNLDSNTDDKMIYQGIVFGVPVTRADLERDPELLLFMDIPIVVPSNDPNDPAHLQFHNIYPKNTNITLIADLLAPPMMNLCPSTTRV